MFTAFAMEERYPICRFLLDGIRGKILIRVHMRCGWIRRFGDDRHITLRPSGSSTRRTRRSIASASPAAFKSSGDSRKKTAAN